MGVMPEKQAWFNIRHFLSEIFYIKGYKEKSNEIISIDPEKACNAMQFNTHLYI